MDAATTLGVLAHHLKQDLSFAPSTSHQTTRWHASVAGHDVEMLCTGPKFWDTRAARGGGGAVDLVMHLFGMDFKHAIKVLQERGV